MGHWVDLHDSYWHKAILGGKQELIFGKKNKNYYVETQGTYILDKLWNHLLFFKWMN